MGLQKKYTIITDSHVIDHLRTKKTSSPYTEIYLSEYVSILKYTSTSMMEEDVFKYSIE